MKISMEQLNQALLSGVLFLAAMNFQAKFFYFIFLALLLLVVFQKKLVIHQTTFVYFALGLIMAVYNYHEGIMSMIRCFSYFSLYLVGYNLIIGASFYYDRTDDCILADVEEKGSRLLMVIASGSFAHYLLNYALNWNQSMGRNTIDVWSKQIMAATGQSTLACLMLGLSIALILLPKKKKNRIIGVVCLLLILAYNLILAGRTLIVMTIVIFSLGIYYRLRISESHQDRLKLWIGLIGGILLLIGAVVLNIGGTQDLLLNSNLFNRLSVGTISFYEEGSRMSVKIKFLKNVIYHPFGGLNLRAEHGYAHDLLLDGYDEYGIFGFIILVMILVTGINQVRNFLMNDQFHANDKMIVLCMYVSVLLVFFIEPILAGMTWLFACYCLINGVLTAMNMKSKRILLE